MKKTIPFLFLLFITQLRASDPFPSSVHPNSLLHKAWSIHSQFGEEGILEEILKRLQITDGFFVEFGAADGAYASNTRFLADRGWKGAFIESSRELIERARLTCNHLFHVQIIHEFVTWDPQDPRGRTFDEIADQFFPFEEIDVLSIDIDGADLQILETLWRKPKIIIIEGGVYWHPTLTTRIPDPIAFHEINQPLPVIFEVARKKGYKPVCFTINTFFVREDLYPRFQEIQNDPVTLWFDSWYYYSKKNLPHILYVKNARETNPNIRQFDELPSPPISLEESTRLIPNDQ